MWNKCLTSFYVMVKQFFRILVRALTGLPLLSLQDCRRTRPSVKSWFVAIRRVLVAYWWRSRQRFWASGGVRNNGERNWKTRKEEKMLCYLTQPAIHYIRLTWTGSVGIVFQQHALDQRKLQYLDTCWPLACLFVARNYAWIGFCWNEKVSNLKIRTR